MKIDSISFCIPTFNRYSYLKNLIDSIISQKFYTDFEIELIIIDDGSSDKTFDLIKFYQEKNLPNLNIVYQYQTNKGRSHALYYSIFGASKEFLVIMDDDDIFHSDFFYNITKINNLLIDIDTKNIAGVCYLCLDDDNKIIGNKFPSNFFISNYSNIRSIHKKKGDFGDIVKTDIVKSSLYPLIDNEKRAPTGLIHLNIDKNYNLIFFNFGLKIKRYLSDGISKNIIFHKINSPNYSYIYEYKLLYSSKLTLFYKIKCIINLNRFYFHGASLIKHKNYYYFILGVLFFIISIIMYFKDKVSVWKKLNK